MTEISILPNTVHNNIRNTSLKMKFDTSLLLYHIVFRDIRESLVPGLLYYLLYKSHHRHPGSFYSPMLHYWRVRYHPCVWPPSYSASRRLHQHESVDLDATMEHGFPFHTHTYGIVYLCLCFYNEPETRPENLPSWLVFYSPGDVSHLFSIPVEFYPVLKP